MNKFLKRAVSTLLTFVMLMSCSLLNISTAYAADPEIIDKDSGNGSWSFLSSNTTFLDTNLATSSKAEKLVSLGTYTDSNKVDHTLYSLGGANNPTNLEYSYADMKFIATADSAVTFRAFKGFGRLNLDPGAAISVPVNGPCKITVGLFVDANPASGSEGYTGSETGETEDGKITLYADGSQFAEKTPLAINKGTNTSYDFIYNGEKPADIKIENSGSKILAIATVTTKHVVQQGADVKDCSESKSFPFSGKVYVVGDETACEYTAENVEKYNFKQGWGQNLSNYFGSEVTINNLAVAGKSSKSFVSDVNYTTLIDSMKTGDYLLIQMSNNDENESDAASYTVPISKIGDGSLDWRKSDDGTVADGSGNNVPCFEWFLYNKYIKPAREAGAQPVLITPVTKRDDSGSAKEDVTHNLYAEAVRQLAADYKVPLIDVNYDSTKYWNEVYAQGGADATKALHALTESGEVDNTNLSKVGADAVAKMVASSAKKLGLALGAKSTVEVEKVKEITVDANAAQTNVSTLTFKTVSDAMKFIESCNTPTSEEERVTLNFKKGVYREQIFVNAPYLTFKNADSTSYSDVVLTWYYGIGYKYYSIGADGFYDKDTMRENQINDTYTAACTNWGHTVRVNSTATGFKADNITFESSFDRYVTKEEIEDGCTPVDISNAEEKAVFYKDGTVKKPDRVSLGVGSTTVQGKDYRERSCAFFAMADKMEMNGCYFVSEQDTLGTNHMRQYYKDCVIEGTVDYICGTGNSIFDNCELKWGTTANASGGYVTAPKGNYLFYKCKVTGNGNDKTNSWARPWGGQNSNLTAFKTTITKNKNSKLNILGSGYANMSKNLASEARFYEYGSVDENGNAVDTSGRLKNTLQPFGTVVTDKWLMLEFNPYNYTTGKYKADNPNVRYTVDDWDPMNRAERMKPILEAINFDLASCGKNIAYDETNNVYTVGAETVTLPAVADGYERKVVSSSSNVVVSDDGNVLTVNHSSEATDATLTVYYREKDSDEWGDKRVIALKITEKGATPVDPVDPTDEYILGDFNNDKVIDVNDAALVLSYVLNKSDSQFKDFTKIQIDSADVTYDKKVTAEDVAQILAKVLDKNFVFTRKDFDGKVTTTTTTEATTDESTESSTDVSEPTTSAEVENNFFVDSDDFSSWIRENHDDAVGIDRANEDEVFGNATPKILLPNKAVFKKFANPISSGVYEFSTDFLTTNEDTATGRSFRIYFESAATADNGNGIATDAFDFSNIFYHLTDFGGSTYVVAEDNTGCKVKTDNTFSAGNMESNKWYHISVKVDFDNKTQTTAIYLHGTDGTYAPETSWTTPIADPVTTPLISKDPLQLKQIRLVRTIGGNVYFDNVSVKEIK